MAARLLEAAFGNLLVAAALAVAAAAAQRLTRRPALAHALWLLVLLKLVTPPVVAVPVRCLPPEPPAKVTTPPRPAVTPPPAPMPDVPPAVWDRILAQSAEPSAPAPEPPSAEPPPAVEAPVAAEPDRPFPWADAATAVWLAGVVGWVALALARLHRFGRLLRFASEPPDSFAAEVADVARRIGLAPPRVRLLPGALAPMVWAVGRPTLFFPAALLDRLPPARRAALVAHELAHLKRRDHLVRWLEFAVLALYWWCPLAWLARRELRRAEEECCDGWVLAVLPAAARCYALALLDTIDFMAAPPPPALATGLGDAASLRRRLELILGPPRPTRLRRRARAAVAVLGAALVLAAPKLAHSAGMNDEPPTPAEATSTTEPTPAAPEEEPAEPVQFGSPAQLAGGRAAALAVLSADGRRVALASADGTVTVRDAATGQELVKLTGHAAVVAGVAFSPDGRLIATASHDGTAKLWDARTGAERRTLRGHASWVVGVVFSPDGRTLATGGYDKAVHLWDAETGAPKAVWDGYPAGVRCLAFSPDGATLAAGGADKTVLLRDVATGAVTARLDHRAGVRCLAFSPDGRLLATGGEGRAARVWDVASAREVTPAAELPDFVTDLRFSPGGRVLLAGTAGGQVVNLDPHTGRPRGPLPAPDGSPAAHPHAAAVTGLAFADGGVYSAARDGSLARWSAAAPPEPPRVAYRGHTDLVRAVAVSPDGKVIATGARDGSVRLWHAATGIELRRLAGHEGEVAELAFTPDGGRLVSGGSDERVRVWEARTGRLLRTVALSAPVGGVSVSPDGAVVAVACPRLPTIALCSLATGDVVRRLGGRAAGVSAVAFAPDGKSLAGGSVDGYLSLWDPATGEERARAAARDAPCRVDGLAFAADGRTAVAVLNDPGAGPDGDDPGRPPAHEVVFWDVADGSVRDGLPPLEHAGPVGRAALTPDGSATVTAGHDGTVRVWESATGRLVRVIRGHAEPVSAVAVAPDGSAVYSAGDRAARRWPLDPPPKP